jgi:hypothetical protein
VIRVVLAWTSDRLSLAQKWLATLVWPDGVGIVLWLGGFWATCVQSCSSVRQIVPNQLGKPVSSSCTSTGLFGPPAQGLAIVLPVAPVLVALYLGLRIQDRDVV